MTYTATPAAMHSGHDIRDERGHMVAIVHNPKANRIEGAKIAALMAAAPELLAALQAAVNLLSWGEAFNSDLPDATTNEKNAAKKVDEFKAIIARAAYIEARDAAPTSDLIKASPALLAAARLTLDYLETLPYQPSIHPSTKAQDALHDAIVAAQGVPT